MAPGTWLAFFQCSIGAIWAHGAYRANVLWPIGPMGRQAHWGYWCYWAVGSEVGFCEGKQLI